MITSFSTALNRGRRGYQRDKIKKTQLERTISLNVLESVLVFPFSFVLLRIGQGQVETNVLASAKNTIRSLFRFVQKGNDGNRIRIDRGNRASLWSVPEYTRHSCVERKNGIFENRRPRYLSERVADGSTVLKRVVTICTHRARSAAVLQCNSIECRGETPCETFVQR